MDSAEDEDVSARVLLRNVLHTETQRSPVTRSASRNQRLRRTSRFGNASETPHVALRQKLKQKLHETATQSPLPPSKRLKSQGQMRKTAVALPSPALYDDEVTPRRLLRRIIQTEADTSLLLSGQTAIPQRDQRDVEASIHSNRHSDAVSGLELPDLATEPLTHVIRGMSRRRPPPTFNVSTFEKHLDQPSGENEEEMEVPRENGDTNKEQDLSAGSQSLLSLTLKTPFADIRSERTGLTRKAAGRRKQLSVDAFDEAVQKRLEGHDTQEFSVVQSGGTLQDSDWHKLTLGMSNATMPDPTTDVMMSNTELFVEPDKLQVSGGVTGVEIINEDDVMGKDLQDVVLKQKDMFESNTSKPQPDPSEHLEVDSQSQSEKNELEIIPFSQENNDIPFAFIQPIVDHVTLPQEKFESAVYEAEVKEMGLRIDETIQEEDKEPSYVFQQITRRAYHSEGGAIRKDVMARGRGTKSLGMGQNSVEEQLPRLTDGSELEGIDNVEEEEHHSPVISSTIHAATPLSSMTQLSNSMQNADEEDVHALCSSESKEDLESVNGSLPVDSSVAEKEEGQREELEESRLEEQEEGDRLEEGDRPEELEKEEADRLEELEKEEGGQLEESEEEPENESEEEGGQLEEPEEEMRGDRLEESEEEVEQEQQVEDAESAELSMQTPAFIRQRKRVQTPGALATPTILKVQNAGLAPKAVKAHPKPKSRRVSTGVLPKSYVMSVFKHFAKTKVASDVYPVINDILQRYFDRMADDLKAYSAHANRKTIEVEDVELLMRRQGFVTDTTSVNSLIEKFLPFEYRKLLIPIATSGNKVIPGLRR